MKRVFMIFLAAILCLTSCANLNEEEKVYEEYKPEVDVTDYAVYASGASIILDKNTVRKRPLIKYNKFCDIDDIEFDLNYPDDDRYIDYDALGSVDVVVSGNDLAQAAQPNGNYLADGETRMKLCPDKVCREDETLTCTHINLVGGYVWGNYVYYIGKYKAEEQKIGQWNAEYENYLMRYSIPDNELELVARLPWFSYIVNAAYGVLYIAYLEDEEYHMTRYTPYTLIYDCENVRIAKIDGFNALLLTERDGGTAVKHANGFYYLNGNTFWRCDYDLTDHTIIGDADFGDSLFGQVTLLGYTKDRIIYKVFDYITQKKAVRSLKDDGKRRNVIESCTDAVLLCEGTFADLYVIEEKQIVRYNLNRLGLGENRTVLFTESEKLAANEHLQSISVKHGLVYFTAAVGQHGNHTRTYLLTDDGAFLHSESGAPNTDEENES